MHQTLRNSRLGHSGQWSMNADYVFSLPTKDDMALLTHARPSADGCTLSTSPQRTLVPPLTLSDLVRGLGSTALGKRLLKAQADTRNTNPPHFLCVAGSHT